MEFWNIDRTILVAGNIPQNHSPDVSLLVYVDFFLLVALLAVVFFFALVEVRFVLLVFAVAFFVVDFASVFFLAAVFFLAGSFDFLVSCELLVFGFSVKAKSCRRLRNSSPSLALLEVPFCL